MFTRVIDLDDLEKISLLSHNRVTEGDGCKPGAPRGTLYHHV